MSDNSKFEASIKSGIHSDPDYILKHDEIIMAMLRETRNFLITGLILLLAGIGILGASFYRTGFSISFGKLALAAVPLLASFVCLFLYFYRGKVSSQDLREFYEEGLLTGAMIISTEPLALMALANITAYDGVPNHYACYKLKMKRLDGAKGELYEKIPCSSFFEYKDGNYHLAFQPHPLYWGTRDLASISQALDTLERENLDEDQDTWEVIRRVANQFPDLKDGQLVILDENYQPLGIRYYWQTGLDEIPGKEKSPESMTSGSQSHGQADYPGGQDEADAAQGTGGSGHSGRPGTPDGPGGTGASYEKQPQEAVLNMRDKPGKEVYERFLQLACRHKVYNYIESHCKNGSIASCANPGFFNPIGDPVTFPQELRERKLTLMSQEYPLFMGKYLATNKGFYRKGRFIPWREAQITVKADFVDSIKVYINGKYCTEFASSIEGYEGREQMADDDKSRIAKLEAKRVEEFLLDIQEHGV